MEFNKYLFCNKLVKKLYDSHINNLYALNLLKGKRLRQHFYSLRINFMSYNESISSSHLVLNKKANISLDSNQYQKPNFDTLNFASESRIYAHQDTATRSELNDDDLSVLTDLSRASSRSNFSVPSRAWEVGSVVSRATSKSTGLQKDSLSLYPSVQKSSSHVPKWEVHVAMDLNLSFYRYTSLSNSMRCSPDIYALLQLYKPEGESNMQSLLTMMGISPKAASASFYTMTKPTRISVVSNFSGLASRFLCPAMQAQYATTAKIVNHSCPHCPSACLSRVVIMKQILPGRHRIGSSNMITNIDAAKILQGLMTANLSAVATDIHIRQSATQDEEEKDYNTIRAAIRQGTMRGFNAVDDMNDIEFNTGVRSALDIEKYLSQTATSILNHSSVVDTGSGYNYCVAEVQLAPLMQKEQFGLIRKLALIVLKTHQANTTIKGMRNGIVYSAKPLVLCIKNGREKDVIVQGCGFYNDTDMEEMSLLLHESLLESKAIYTIKGFDVNCISVDPKSFTEFFLVLLRSNEDIALAQEKEDLEDHIDHFEY